MTMRAMRNVNRTIESLAAILAAILAKFRGTGFVAKEKTARTARAARTATTKAATTVQAMRNDKQDELKSSPAQAKTNNVPS